METELGPCSFARLVLFFDGLGVNAGFTHFCQCGINEDDLREFVVVAGDGHGEEQNVFNVLQHLSLIHI